MSNSIFVPVHRVPADLQEIRNAIRVAFLELGAPEPNVQMQVAQDGRVRPLRDSIILVEGSGSDEHCWISFGDYPEELTGLDQTKWMADVTTRGSWLFGAMVVLALFVFGGATAINDAGELDGQEAYDATSLRHLIAESLASGERFSE